MDNHTKPYLSVIIPAYNEAESIPKTLLDIDKHLSKADFEYEIVVVNDGSRDNTAEVVKSFMPTIKNLRLIDNKENKGKGEVVRQGLLEARGKYRLFDDADNSTSIDHFFKMVPHLEEGYEIVIGSRDIKGSEMVPPQPLYKRIFGDMGNVVIQTLLLRGIKDTQCGFKCFREDVVNAVFPKMRIKKWAIDVEALSLAKALGFKIKEIPVRWVNDFTSTVKLSDYFKFLVDVFRIRVWLWRDIYGIKKGK